MRNKVVIVKGWANIGRETTLAEFERINADHIVVMCALRRPQFLPPEFILDLSKIEMQTKMLMEYWKSIEQDHHLASEYATVAVDRGREAVRIVEGDCLTVPWFYETVRAMHKYFGQSVVEAEVIHGRDNGIMVRIEEVEMTRQQAIQRLRPHPLLG